MDEETHDGVMEVERMRIYSMGRGSVFVVVLAVPQGGFGERFGSVKLDHSDFSPDRSIPVNLNCNI